jgi:hypothetical protein
MIFKSNIVEQATEKVKIKNVLPGIIVAFHLSCGSCEALISYALKCLKV